ncbi:hypothetical protein KC347_g257 [Hortaea werneckii]|nr:hypothetical protein KC347_g257 [Hortaea werneckii]
MAERRADAAAGMDGKVRTGLGCHLPTLCENARKRVDPLTSLEPAPVQQQHKPCGASSRQSQKIPNAAVPLEPCFDLLLSVLQRPLALRSLAEDFVNLRLGEALRLNGRVVAQTVLLSNFFAGDWSALLAICALVYGHNDRSSET